MSPTRMHAALTAAALLLISCGPRLGECREGWLRCYGSLRLEPTRCIAERCVPIQPPRLVLGVDAGCALRDGVLTCWGSNEYGLLGEPSPAHADRPRPVAGLPDAIAGAALGRDLFCAWTEAGDAWCWGHTDFLDIGLSSAAPPTRVEGLTDVVDLAVGKRHICALDDAGDAWCWGQNISGQLGDGTRDEARRPRRVELPEDATALAAGRAHTCALLESGRVACWGDNRGAALGLGAAESTVLEPAPVLDLNDAVTLSAGARHTCAARAGGALQCWGDDHHGQLGANVHLPSDVLQLSASGDGTCALSASGPITCWGYDATAPGPPSPRRGRGLGDAVTVARDAEGEACAMDTRGAVWCWRDGLSASPQAVLEAP